KALTGHHALLPATLGPDELEAPRLQPSCHEGASDRDGEQGVTGRPSATDGGEAGRSSRSPWAAERTAGFPQQPVAAYRPGAAVAYVRPLAAGAVHGDRLHRVRFPPLHSFGFFLGTRRHYRSPAGVLMSLCRRRTRGRPSNGP